LRERQVAGPTLSGLRARLILLSAAGAAILLFSGVFGLGLLSADHPFWVNPANDMTIMLGGYEALLHAPWRFPPAVVTSLTGVPVSIVYTDSLPWLSLALKASGMGASINPLALFLLISYPLQALGMIALLRALGVERLVALLAGAALALCFPPWIGRQIGHIALSGHWIIIFALALAVASARRGLTPTRIAAFAALAAVATGVHAYHLVPVAACFGAALLSELLQRPHNWLRCGLAALAVLGGVFGSAAILGYGAGLGQTGGAADLGLFAMNLAGPLLPVGSRLFGQVWNGYWFTRTIDPTGAQSFEGLQYLGAGGVLLVAFAGLGAIQACARFEWRSAIVRWGPLALAMLILAIWAVGWNVYFGDVLVARIPKPSGHLAAVLGAFRAHGRFFWAPGYLLLALGVAWASRRPQKLATPLLIAAVALQAWDMGPLRQGVRQTYYRPAPSAVPTSLREASWIVGRKWVFAPTVFCSPVMADRRVIAEYDLLIMRSGGQANTYATARNNDPPCGQSPSQLALDATRGDDTITVVPTGRGIFTPELQQIAWRSDCFQTPRTVLCGRGMTALADVTPLARGALAASPGPIIYEAHMAHGDMASVLTTGWWVADLSGAGVWSSVRTATISLPIPPSAVPVAGVVIDLGALAYSEPPLRPQRVAVFVNGRPSASLQVGSGSFRTYRLLVSREVVLQRQALEIVFDLPEARAPLADPRLLGIALQSVVVRANAAERPRVAVAEAGQARVQ
jgi:hypothetical protein